MSFELSIADEISNVRFKLDDGPLSSRTLRAVDAFLSTSPQERVVDSALNYLGNLIAIRTEKANVRFCEVTSDEDWRRVRELRQRCYPVSLPYLVDVIGPDGSDRHDRHSFVYAAFVGDRPVATIRATTYPYETLDYVSEAELATFLGPSWKTDYIEWGRLLVDRNYSKMRITPALITYAGIRIAALTPYRNYFGYIKPNTRALISKFAFDKETLQFKIPSRGNHHYLLIKGGLNAGAIREIPKWLGRMSRRFVRRDGSVSTARPMVQ